MNLIDNKKFMQTIRDLNARRNTLRTINTYLERILSYSVKINIRDEDLETIYTCVEEENLVLLKEIVNSYSSAYQNAFIRDVKGKFS